MMIYFLCKCGLEMKAPDERADQQGRCPRCGQEVIVPPPLPKIGAGALTREILAGVYVEIAAEEDLTVRPSKGPRPTRPALPDGDKLPSPDKMQVNVHIEAKEDLTVRPSRFPMPIFDSPPPPIKP